MQYNYNDWEIKTAVGNVTFQVLNLVYEKFLRTIPSHSHGEGCYEIHYIDEGYGRACIDGSYYEITPGTLYVTGPHVEHSQTPYQENPMCEYCIYLKMAKKRKEEEKKDTETELILESIKNTAFWFGQDTQQIFGVISRIFQSAKEQQEGYSLELKALLQLMLIKLARNYRQDNKRNLNSLRTQTYDKTSIIVEEYFLYEYQKLSLEELSGRLGLSPRQTERFLKSHYNKNFLQKKTDARMSAAAIQLTNTTKSITEISENLGYTSIEHFSTAFKKYYNISPTQYRKKIGQKIYDQRKG